MFSKIFNSVIAPLCILIPIIAGLIKFKNQDKKTKIILWYLITTAIINTASIITARIFHTNNSPIAHIYTAIEMIMLIWFYKNLLEIKTSTKWFTILQIAFISGSIVNAVFFQSIYTFCSYTRSLESIICMLFALNYFAKIASTEIRVLNDAGFYFNTGIFLYFSGAFMLFIFSNFLVTKLSKIDFLIIWNIHACLFLLMYIFFTTGFILNKKNG